MKELSIEQKAKRYDVTIKRLEDIKTGKCQKTFMYTEGLFDYIFPELKESEDEEMRETLVKFFTDWGKTKSHCWGVPVSKILAWLEKQGEHANFINKIQVGDKITRNKDGVLVNLSQLKRVAKPSEKQGDANKEYWRGYREGKKEILDKYSELEKQGEQKPAWSEEDEDILNTIINHFTINLECTEEDDLIVWLKSIKYRYSWKPSDEQMEALRIARDRNDRIGFYLLQLYNELKKLM